jgi:hypothetical protein
MTAKPVRHGGHWPEPGRPVRAVVLANGANRTGAAMKVGEEEPPKQLRVRTVGTKLTDREYAKCEKSAARRGQTLSEWYREALLAAVESRAQRPEDEAILSEILALRKIVINLLYGDKAGEPLSKERMQELIEAADSDKLRKAAERLQAVRTARAGVLSDDNRGESVREPFGDGASPGGLAKSTSAWTITVFLLAP